MGNVVGENGEVTAGSVEATNAVNTGVAETATTKADGEADNSKTPSDTSTVEHWKSWARVHESDKRAALSKVTELESALEALKQEADTLKAQAAEYTKLQREVLVVNILTENKLDKSASVLLTADTEEGLREQAAAVAALRGNVETNAPTQKSPAQLLQGFIPQGTNNAKSEAVEDSYGIVAFSEKFRTQARK